MTFSNNPTANSAVLLASGTSSTVTSQQINAKNIAQGKSATAKEEQKSVFNTGFLQETAFLGFTWLQVGLAAVAGIVVWKYILPMLGIRKRGATGRRRSILARARAAKARKRSKM